PHHTSTITQPSTSQPQNTQKPRKPKRKDTQVPHRSGPTNIVTDEVVHKQLGDSLVRAAAIASSLEAEQDNGNITKTQSKATPNESSSLGTTLGGGPRCQETMGDTIAQTRFENVSKHSNDSLLVRGNTLRSDEDGLKLKELIELYEDITLVNVQDDANNEIFYVNTLTGDEVFTEQEVAAKGVNLTVDEVTLAQALAALKSVKPKVKGALEAIKTSKPKVKGIVFQEPGESTTTKSTTISSQQSQDKGKGIMIEESVKPMKKKDLIRLDEEVTLKLQDEFNEEERLAREKAEKEKD
ncbi:hypothetical protein Tco_1477556, partial [Tanacetum coccineum]